MKILLVQISIDYMVGIGLAGFFVLSETNSNSKIVINLWMSPSQNLSYIEFVSPDLLFTLKKMELKTYDWVDAEMRTAVYGIFQPDANSCDKDIFLKIYGRNMNGIDNFSLMKEDKFTTTLEKTFEYFIHIRKQGNWQSLALFLS